jgi:hypothetical protein
MKSINILLGIIGIVAIFIGGFFTIMSSMLAGANVALQYFVVVLIGVGCLVFVYKNRTKK